MSASFCSKLWRLHRQIRVLASHRYNNSVARRRRITSLGHLIDLCIVSIRLATHPTGPLHSILWLFLLCHFDKDGLRFVTVEYTLLHQRLFEVILALAPFYDLLLSLYVELSALVLVNEPLDGS